MKKNILVIGLIVSSIFVFGNEYRAYEESQFSAQPMDAVQNIIDVRTNFNSVKALSARGQNIANINYQILKNIDTYDANQVRHTSIRCSYKNESTGNIITSVFKNKNNIWHLQKIENSKNQRLDKIQRKDYNLYDSQNCVDDFRVNFEALYPNSKLTLFGREAVVNGIIINKKNKTYSSTFNLSYYSINQHTQSGWVISKIDLKPIKKRVVVNRKVPSKHRGFYLKETVPYMSNVRLVSVPNEKGLKLITEPKVKKTKKEIKNKTTKLTKLVCDQKEKFIRVVFTLNKNAKIGSTLIENIKNKYIRFKLDGKQAQIQKGNCSLLSVYDENGFVLNLENLDENIKSLKYGIVNPKVSYIDFWYEKKSWFGG